MENRCKDYNRVGGRIAVEEAGDDSNPPLPVVTSVVPTFFEVEYIERCVRSLLDQTYPAEKHYILVIDGGSTDGTLEVIEKLMLETNAEGPARLRLLHNPDRFVPQARNLAMDNLPEGTELLLELVGHSWVEAEHLEKRVLDMQEHEREIGKQIGAMGARLLPYGDELSLIGRWIHSSLENPFGSGNGSFARFEGKEKTLVPPLALYRREAVEQIGGYDNYFCTGQDCDVQMRLHKAGWPLWRSDVSGVHVQKRKSIVQWIRYGHRCGFWRTKMLKKYPSRASLLEFLPWFGVLLTAALLWAGIAEWWYPAAAYLGVIVLSGLMEAVAMRSISLVIGVPLMLFILHTTFSIGLLEGLYREGNPARDRISHISSSARSNAELQ